MADELLKTANPRPHPHDAVQPAGRLTQIAPTTAAFPAPKCHSAIRLIVGSTSRAPSNGGRVPVELAKAVFLQPDNAATPESRIAARHTAARVPAR